MNLNGLNDGRLHTIPTIPCSCLACRRTALAISGFGLMDPSAALAEVLSHSWPLGPWADQLGARGRRHICRPLPTEERLVRDFEM
jgi:hypothetical protein